MSMQKLRRVFLALGFVVGVGLPRQPERTRRGRWRWDRKSISV